MNLDSSGEAPGNVKDILERPTKYLTGTANAIQTQTLASSEDNELIATSVGSFGSEPAPLLVGNQSTMANSWWLDASENAVHCREITPLAGRKDDKTRAPN